MRLQDKVTIITGAGQRDGPRRGPDVRAPRARESCSPTSRTRPPSSAADEVRAAGGEAIATAADVSKEADAKAHGRHALSTLRSGRRALQQRRDHAGRRPLGHRHRRRRPGTRSWPSTCAACSSAASTPSRAWSSRGRARSSTSRASWRSSGCSVPQDAYTASKGAVLSLTRSLAVQFGPNGVRSERDLPGTDRDAAAHGLAGQGRGGEADPPGSQPDAAGSASRRRSSRWRSTSRRTSRAGRTARPSSSTAGITVNYF